MGMDRYRGDDIDIAIVEGIIFKPRNDNDHSKRDTTDKVRTKAKKKGYATGAHGSASARKKADIRRKRANRHK